MPEETFMLKRLLIAGFMSGLAGPVLAQTNPAPATGGFLTQMPADGLRLSKLRGVDVIGSDITRIGDIEDVLVSRDGQVAGVLVGVGGFLGIGEKSVAVPFASLLWNFEASPTAGPASSNTGTPADNGLRTQAATANDPMSPGVNTTGAIGTPAQTNAGATAAPGGTTPGTTPVTTPGMTPGTGGASAAGGPGALTPMAQGSGNGAARSGMEAAMGGAAPVGSATTAVTGGHAPTRAVLRMTKQELQDAPAWSERR
jgi:sporulation protein YlmC with PRC-barrel domain